jgi:hypothetical protein
MISSPEAILLLVVVLEEVPIMLEVVVDCIDDGIPQPSVELLSRLVVCVVELQTPEHEVVDVDPDGSPPVVGVHTEELIEEVQGAQAILAPDGVFIVHEVQLRLQHFDVGVVDETHGERKEVGVPLVGGEDGGLGGDELVLEHVLEEVVGGIQEG